MAGIGDARTVRMEEMGGVKWRENPSVNGRMYKWGCCAALRCAVRAVPRMPKLACASLDWSTTQSHRAGKPASSRHVLPPCGRRMDCLRRCHPCLQAAVPGEGGSRRSERLDANTSSCCRPGHPNQPGHPAHTQRSHVTGGVKLKASRVRRAGRGYRTAAPATLPAAAVLPAAPRTAR